MQTQDTDLERHFAPFRAKTLGIEQRFQSPYGSQPIIYADWTASGRCYADIEHTMLTAVAPFVANTHTETSVTGRSMSLAYEDARRVIKAHIGANEHDVLLCCGSGMTAAVNKLQRMLGLKVPEFLRDTIKLSDEDRPVVFVSHMEHHSNHTSWLETIADVEIITPDANGLLDLGAVKSLIDKHAGRKRKIAAMTACSNVTGIVTPYHEVARLMHAAGGLCFVDFSSSAPYVAIDMHPEGDHDARLDAIYFSPHKFLGGPGTAGVLAFSSSLYTSRVPDHPGGGTVRWTNPWHGRRYIDDIEAREDGGTPPFLQAIRIALVLKLKEKMGIERMKQRKRELLERAFAVLDRLPNVHVLAGQHRDRMGIISLYFDDLHYNLAVRLLNDRYGIQARGGCSCAGTYGHYLLNVCTEQSKKICDAIDAGDSANKPGWARLSLHPTMTNQELDTILEAITDIARNHRSYAQDYERGELSNEFKHKTWSMFAVDIQAIFAI